MSGDGKRGGAQASVLAPILDSTPLPGTRPADSRQGKLTPFHNRYRKVRNFRIADIRSGWLPIRNTALRGALRTRRTCQRPASQTPTIRSASIPNRRCPVGGVARSISSSSVQPRDVGRDGSLVGSEIVSELRRKQAIFNPNTDFSSNEKQCQRREEQWPRREYEARAQEQTEHRGIDRVPHNRIRSGTDKPVIRVEARVDAPLFAQGPHPGPR